MPAQPQPAGSDSQVPREIGGREGPDPTRFGDWEKAVAASIFDEVRANGPT